MAEHLKTDQLLVKRIDELLDGEGVLDEYEYFGKPITLAMVLRALEKCIDDIANTIGGECDENRRQWQDFDYLRYWFKALPYEPFSTTELEGQWNLTKDLDGQSQEFADWLYNLIK